MSARAYLPAIEPEREVTDWGRSARVERALDRTVSGFLYHYWFRVDVEGVEHVPAAGGALLVANHAGALGADALMIAKAIATEHRRPRPLHVAVERDYTSLPGLAMLIAKLGGVPAHPANVHRLLHDEEQLVLAFPERGPGKLYRDRYRVRRFGAIVASARRARVPVVPVAVIGAEEAMPTFAHLGRLPRLTPVLPAKFRIRFLEPLTAADPEALRAGIQDALDDLLAERRSVWLG